jgi:hypothetical protein
MPKRVFITLCLLVAVKVGAFAQQPYSQNPFQKVNFLNNPIDTITLIASYSQISDKLNIINKTIIETIKRNTGKQIKDLNYFVDLKLGNYPVISVPCADNDKLSILMANTGKNNQVVIKCIVYRFYFYDGICNFFYIDKINLLNKPDLITKN